MEESGEERANLVRLLVAANEKLCTYESEYILPVFERAKRQEINLEGLVMENPGKNCVELYCDALEAMIQKMRNF